jgi:catecholate siderophore receptor
MIVRLSISFGLLAAIFLAIPASAQTATVSITGHVLDPMRGAIVGARVTATGIDASEATALTDQRGEFTLAVRPARYTVTVTASGFIDLTRIVDATRTDERSREFVLQVAGIHEAVTVSATAGYRGPTTITSIKTGTSLIEVPQSVTVVTRELMTDQLMSSVGDVARYVPGLSVHQGENNRDQVIIRGNSSSADFFVNGVRDDVQYYRDLYNLERIEALKGPNALMFGRGGAGGVINRVTKEAAFRPLREVSLQGGMFGNRRVTVDVGEPLTPTIAVRLNGMYENSDSFRRDVGVERYGLTPTVTIAPDSRTKVTLRYEYLHDTRVADRGITSVNGHPADVARSTFYGDPDASHVRSGVNLGAVTFERRLGRATLRTHVVAADYDRFYQNFVPGAPTPDLSRVALTTYNNATARRNLFNQTDLIYGFSTSRLRHTLLAGVELGRQITDNFRNTGFFDNSATSLLVPFGDPLTKTPVTYRQSATDADNHVTATLAATYLQDQIELSRHVQVLAGVRLDRFNLKYHNNRNDDTLTRPDTLVSPRGGVIVKPIAPIAVYGSLGVSHLPSSGDQFSSLTTITQQLEPEKFTNYEVGTKVELGRGLSMTAAAYRLDRTNTRSTDPNDPTRIVQTGSQRTNGVELEMNGFITSVWSIAGGYAYQDASVMSATVSARAGAAVAQVPRHAISLWNAYQMHPRVRAGLGLLRRSDVFATIDNTVTLPGYTRVDAGLTVSLARGARLQGNVENLFDRRYFVNADSNTNISPGAPRTLRVALTTTF